MRCLIQESDCGDDHARRAVRALHGAGLDKGLLNGVQAPVLCEAFDRGDPFPIGIAKRRDAGPDRAPLDQNGARSALPFATAVFRTRDFEAVAQLNWRF